MTMQIDISGTEPVNKLLIYFTCVSILIEHLSFPNNYERYQDEMNMTHASVL